MEIRVPRSAIAAYALSSLLQQGAACPARVPCSVTDFVTRQLSWESEYLRDRISTILLDGMVVDDPDSATVLDKSVLALSAAMPGLVGATLRRGGYYAPMRSELNWTRSFGAAMPALESGVVRVRLYNLILTEKRDALLARGILVDNRQLATLIGDGWLRTQAVFAGTLNLLRVVDDPADAPAGDPGVGTGCR